MTEANGETAGAENAAGGEQAQVKTFTEAEVNQLVQERLAQQAKNKFGDYADLKTRAEGAITLEQRFGALEAELNTTKANALRATVAAEFGISTKKGAKGEPSDADLFLTGTDEASLTAQAQRLAGREADRKKQGNVAPKEGSTSTSGNEDADLREATRALFGRN